ncbi:MAG: trypsin-like peptidase domain-containing protein [Candidatus Wildermuthbacteria bacterium]|nr:trypsin-like peptidase domain-containing protein [Candidatus Wildermuthbacteria bacterium]
MDTSKLAPRLWEVFLAVLIVVGSVLVAQNVDLKHDQRQLSARVENQGKLASNALQAASAAKETLNRAPWTVELDYRLRGYATSQEVLVLKNESNILDKNVQETNRRLDTLKSELSAINAKVTNRLDPVAIFEKTKGAIVEVKTDRVTGTGFLYGEGRNRIVTALHVVEEVPEGSWEIVIKTANQDRIRARLEHVDKDRDLSILELDHPLDTQPLELATSVAEGEEVAAIGNPLGLSNSLSTGIVNGLNREGLRLPFAKLIQFDAVVANGSSGGVLLNREGKVLGIVSRKLGEFGLAVPAGEISKLMQRPPLAGTIPAEVVVEFPPGNAAPLNAVIRAPDEGASVFRTTFTVTGAKPLLRTTKFSKRGSLPDVGLERFTLWVDGERMDSLFRLDPSGAVTFFPYVRLKPGTTHTLEVTAGILPVSSRDQWFIFELQDMELAAPVFFERDGREVTPPVKVRVAGGGNLPVQGRGFTVIPAERG